ncbi:sulfotransferase domain-containing protein [Candidatus Pelagibacter sp.]|nr:sulfotransferase domain-containing protein [Candidatus Pelagibacter sp.]MDC0642280.1 sulfotransferase domain-containing protein [Candidatus Pelagibacter sp.]
MIIWLASYPKSGNTWLRSLLSGYFFSKDGSFNFDLLNNIDQYPSSSYFEKYKDLFTEPESTSKYWLKEQARINKDKKLRFFKTHNALCKIDNNSFTDEQNTLGAIYIVRDPRNILSSLAHHYQINNKDAYEFMKDQKRSLVEKKQDRFLGFNALFSWSIHQKSWSECKKFPVLTIKYEDLEAKTFQTFEIIYKFIQKITKLNKKFDKEKAKKVIHTCKFDKLQQLERIKGFNESMIGKKKERIKFFNLGIKNNYKELLNDTLINQMNTLYSEELKKFNYE